MTVKEAAKIFGNKVELARALGVTRQAVSKWGKNVPPLRVYQIKELQAQKDKSQ